MPLHLIKLCVGADSVEDLADWQRRRFPGGRPRHVTRMRPRREAEVLAGGSLYWVIRGITLVRQRILALEAVEDGEVRRCALALDPALVRVEPRPRAPFQGWRYLEAKDAPPDLPEAAAAEPALPPRLQHALAEMGVRFSRS